MSRYKAYAEYKDSGVEWLGSIPIHWKILQSRRIFAVRSEPALSSDKMLTASQKYGVLYQSDFVEQEGRRVVEVILGVENLKHVEPNDFIISMRSFQGGIEWCTLRGSTSFHYVILKPLKNVVPHFFAHLLKSLPYIHALRRTSDLIRDGQELRFSNFVLVSLPLIPDDEQEKIAGFLDHETAKIDALIEKQQRLIELLKEKRQSVISHAVTKGLNSNAPMKDSGVDWLGEVPAHWMVLQLRRVLTGMEQGKSPECESRPADLNEWGVLKTGCVNNGTFNFNENKFLPEHIAPFSQFEVKNGDVLMSRASGSVDLIGSVAYVDNPREKLLLSDKIFRLRFESSVHKIFFTRLMQSSYMRSNIKVEISGAEGMANNITKSSINSFRFALPPFEEQASIAQAIEKKVSTLDRLIQRSVSGIDLLLERRTALISAAVTGKIDVRDWQAAA